MTLPGARGSQLRSAGVRLSRPLRFPVRLLLLPAAVAFTAAAYAAGSAVLAIQPLESPPDLFFSAVALPAGDRFVLTDLLGGSLRVYAADGKLKETIRRPGLGELEWNRPAVVFHAGQGLLLQDGGFHLVSLDHALVPQEGIWLPGGPEGRQAIRAETSEGAVSQLVAGGAALAIPGHLVLYADVRQGERWRSGVWRLDRKELRRLDPLLEWPSGATDWYVYQDSVMPSLAAIGERVFFLRADQAVALEQLLPVRKTLPVPPPYTGKLPPLAHHGGREHVLELCAAFSRLSLVRSIHAWEGSLYLLGARFGSSLSWELWRWDDEAGWRGPLTLDLPAGTREVVVAPGPEQWFLILQGARPSVEEQKVLGLTHLDAAEIRATLR